VDQDVIERLELKIAFLEKANTELSDVIYRQQREIGDLQDRLTMLKDRFETFAVQPAEYSVDDEKPPHY
jgi:SlyX protein